MTRGSSVENWTIIFSIPWLPPFGNGFPFGKSPLSRGVGSQMGETVWPEDVTVAFQPPTVGSGSVVPSILTTTGPAWAQRNPRRRAAAKAAKPGRNDEITMFSASKDETMRALARAEHPRRQLLRRAFVDGGS